MKKEILKRMAYDALRVIIFLLVVAGLALAIYKYPIVMLPLIGMGIILLIKTQFNQ